MKKIVLFSFLVIAVNVVLAQTSGKKESLIPKVNRPALVVGIVVDQMRYDYLFRYWNKYSEGGFKRLVSKGFNFENANYNYVPTYTAPGHACIYTGTSPSYNGIVSNDWYDRDLKKSMY